MENTAKVILVVEDELPIARVLMAYFKKNGFGVLHAATLQEAEKCTDNAMPDLIVLDVLLPDGLGWDYLEQLRKSSAVPVVMLTAMGEVPDRIKGLRLGADDYIAKPFDPNEVVARVEAVLRRAKTSRLQDEQRTYIGRLMLDQVAMAVFYDGKEVLMTPRDRSLLFFLAAHPGQLFDREQLIERVWGYDYEGSDRAVDLAVKRIRKALPEWLKEDGEIRTVRGMGYQLHVYEKA